MGVRNHGRCTCDSSVICFILWSATSEKYGDRWNELWFISTVYALVFMGERIEGEGDAT